MKTKIKSCIVLTFCILSVSLCALFTACAPTETMLAAFDDDQIIASDNNSFVIINGTDTTNNHIHTEKSTEFTGVKTIATIFSRENPFLNCELTITGGEFKLVAVNTETKNVVVLVKENANGLTPLTLPSGKYKIKIVGRYANFNLKIDLLSFD